MSKSPSFYIPRAIRPALSAVAALLVAVSLASLLAESHPLFGIDGSPGFFSWFGLLAGGAAIILARIFGLLMQRPEHYYQKRKKS